MLWTCCAPAGRRFTPSAETPVPTAYFDVDGTLVKTNLLHPTVMVLANQATPQQSLTRIGRALLDGPRMAWAERSDRRKFNEMLFMHYKGVTADRMAVLSEEMFESMLKPRLFKGSVDLVQKCKDAGQRVVFITGNLDTIITPLARFLGADHVISNRLEFKAGKATGKLMRPVVAGPTKARLMVEDARSVGHDLAHCHAYSDSYSDVPMLSVVGHPNCVHPDKQLASLAVAYNWPILDVDTVRVSP